MKPYAVPVRVLPFHFISGQKVRDLRDELKDALIARGLIVAGFFTDGEWNSMRTQGSSCPVNRYRAVEGRGFSEEDRSHHIKAMLHWLLRDWIPSIDEQSIDFRLLDVARNISISKNKQDRFDIIKKSRRTDPGVFCARRASLPIHNATTVRTKFHEFQETLPQLSGPNESI
eukprot:gene3920-15245_t